MPTAEQNKNRIVGFPPVFTSDSHTLILGSMPGEESLRLGQYYANSRNAFWRILATHTGNENNFPYELRLKLLNDHHIALWDVLDSCKRSGSLDSAIQISSMDTNDFQTFLAGNPKIRRIFFNGTFAETAYRKYVTPYLAAREAGISVRRLPSTSPANASICFEAKLLAWRAIFD